jgi:hypothetical protein
LLVGQEGVPFVAEAVFGQALNFRQFAGPPLDHVHVLLVFF